MTRRGAGLALAALVGIGGTGWFTARTLLDDSFEQGPTRGPFTADGRCPIFQPIYPRCTVRFGNRGLSIANSLYETFLGKGAFEIGAFRVSSHGAGRYTITAASNRGPITSQIHADRVVRLGQEKEDEKVNRTHQSAFCDGGRIYEHQVGYAGGEPYIQDLEFWTERNNLRFRLFQGGSPTADVECSPARTLQSGNVR